MRVSLFFRAAPLASRTRAVRRLFSVVAVTGCIGFETSHAAAAPASGSGQPVASVSTITLHILPAAPLLWHKVTLELAGPSAQETGDAVNPFTDYRFDVTFVHPSTGATHTIPGYFAADGRAAETSATSGNVWRVLFSPEHTGKWNYRVRFLAGPGVAMDERGGRSVEAFDGLSGSFVVASAPDAASASQIGRSSTSSTGAASPVRDFAARGRVEYVGGRYLRFAGSGEYFLKAGADSPETLLAYSDFDDTTGGRKEAPLKTWQPHVRDWREGDPTWHGGRGKGLIGALNYLAAKGVNSISFLTYNAGGDGDSVWPFVSRNDKLHYDCSKLDQWGIVFEHAQRLGLHLHFKLQENEIDDDRVGPERRPQIVPESLDGGALGPERRLYLRELIARYGYLLALTWNLGEENTQSPEEQRAMAHYIRELHGYPVNLVVHTFTHEYDRVYRPLLGAQSVLTGASLQVDWMETHQWTLHWLEESARAGRPWVVANDEQGHWAYGVPPDFGYKGFDGVARDPRRSYTLHDIRKLVLWGNLMAGGSGVEYYFGYQLPQHDLDAEDFRSRDQSWTYAHVALEFFRRQKIPFWEMASADALLGNAISAESRFCLAKPGELYLVYLPYGGPATIDLRAARGDFTVKWFNPRTGEEADGAKVSSVTAGDYARLGTPPADESDDWLILLRRVSL
ncbi:MAG TPA: DUF5060 domain-containing protein [Opitutaceae bacterium]|nr:DUF5060 domain-containing protein [Opitutaceae bacterium]